MTAQIGCGLNAEGGGVLHVQIAASHAGHVGTGAEGAGRRGTQEGSRDFLYWNQIAAD